MSLDVFSFQDVTVMDAILFHVELSSDMDLFFGLG